jgi:hypothetical protein
VVVQTADTTFQQSWGPAQHASLAAVPAVEAGRPVVQVAISGVSAAFDARGRRIAWQPTNVRGATVVELSRERTPMLGRATGCRWPPRSPWPPGPGRTPPARCHVNLPSLSSAGHLGSSRRAAP